MHFCGIHGKKGSKEYLKGGIRIVKRLLILLFGNLEVGSLFLRSFKDYCFLDLYFPQFSSD